MKFKKMISLVLSLSMTLGTTVNGAFNAENNVTLQKTQHSIAPGLTYSSSVEMCDGIRQEIHSFEYVPNEQTLILPAYGEYLYGFNSVGKLISTHNGNGRVVGGINTDFFITNTGVPLSCLIKNGEIISSCDSRAALGMDKNGKAVIGYPQITAKLFSNEKNKELNIIHINKTPGIWGIYLVTNTFAKTTKSTQKSIEVVLTPFQKNQNTEISPTANIANKPDLETSNNILQINEEIQTESNILTQNESVQYDFSSYLFNEAPLILGKDINVVVTEIRTDATNAEIPHGSYVACIPQEQFGYLAADIAVGDEFILSTSCNAAFAECENIFGAGSVILENGSYVAQTNDSIYKFRNPRTAAGIKEDGTIVFVCIDGRQSGKSVGYTITELADYLISLGCVTAVNFDGGGSTTFYAADIGEPQATLKNSPSDGSERKVADGLIFINLLPSGNNVQYGSFYPSEYTLYNKGVSLDFNNQKILFADENYHPITVPNENIALSANNSFGNLQNGVFVPNGNVGTFQITATVGDVTLNVANVSITDTIDKFTVKLNKESLSPFENSAKLILQGSYSTIPVNLTATSAEWSIYIPSMGYEAETFMKAVGSDVAYINYETGEFVPIKRGVEYYITATINGVNSSAKIYAEKLPFDDMDGHWAAETAYNMYKSEFMIGETDFSNARYFVPERNMTLVEFCTVLSRILAENDSTVNIDSAKEPFDLVMTDNILKFGETAESTNQTANTTYLFADVPEWGRGYVYSLYKKGYLNDLFEYDQNGAPTLNAEKYITRNDVIRILGAVLTDCGNNTDYEPAPNRADYIPQTENDELYFNALIQNEILTGYEDGTIRQYSNLTRAQAATVFSRFIDFKNSNNA